MVGKCTVEEVHRLHHQKIGLTTTILVSLQNGQGSRRLTLPYSFKDYLCEDFNILKAEINSLTCKLPVGNSSAGEMAFKWTYDALYQIRDDIRARGEK